MHIPSFNLISQSMLKKSPENSDGRTDGRTDGQTDGHCHSIIRPFFKRAYKNHKSLFLRSIWTEVIIGNSMWPSDVIWPQGSVGHGDGLCLVLCQVIASTHDDLLRIFKHRNNIIHVISWAKEIFIWVRSRNCGCLITWFCYQLIAKPGNKTAAVSWPDPSPCAPVTDRMSILPPVDVRRWHSHHTARKAD